MTETTAAFTLAQFVLIAIFAVLVLAGILWGIKLKRIRLKAQDEVEAYREAREEAPAAPPIPGSAPDPLPAEHPVIATPLAETSPTAAMAEDVAATPLPDAPKARLAGDITQLKGLGPKLATTLAELGITRVDQIAAMSPADLAELDAKLGTFKGRPARDRWTEQAHLLVAGDKAAYEAEFGRLG